MILAAAYTDERGLYVRPPRSRSATAATSTTAQPVTRESGKMGKS